MDDDSLAFDPGLANMARQIGRNVVESLGPSDLAAVVFTAFGRNQNWTTDRAQLLAAVDTLVPHPNTVKCGGRCQAETLMRIGDIIGGGPAGRKLVVHVGVPLPRFAPEQSSQYDRVIAALQRANVTVYAFNPLGLRTKAPTAAQGGFGAMLGGRFPTGDAPALAELTGGREVTGDNRPWDEIPAMLRETGEYYLVGYQSSHSAADGRYHRIRVELSRPGLEAFTRDGYFASKPKLSKNTGGEVPALDAALGQGLPVRGVPLRLAAATFSGHDRNLHTLALVTGVRDDADRPAPTAMVATVFDTNWKPVTTFRQTVAVTGRMPDPNAWFEVFSTFTLPPGRYEVRVAAERDGQAGSVFLDVDVPDFARLPLSMSSLTLSRADGARTADAEALTRLLPAVPTSAREFTRADRVSAFVRIYRDGIDAPAPVIARWRVLGADDETRADTTLTTVADRPLDGHAADLSFDLPLATLSPGDYLLRVDATLDNRIAQRELVFHVR